MIIRLAAIVIAVNAFYAGIVGYALYQSREHYAKTASVAMGNLTQMFEGGIERIFGRTDAAVQAVADEARLQLAEGSLDKPSLDRYIAGMHSRLPEVLVFRATDASGRAIFGTPVSPAGTMSVADTEHFRLLRQARPGGEAVVSRPVAGDIDGRKMIVVARPITSPSGSFAGIVYAGVSVDYLARRFSEIDLQGHGLIALHDADGAMVTSYPQEIDDRKHRHARRQLQQLIKEGRTVGVISGNHVTSFRRVALARPYYVTACTDEKEFLAGWRQEAAKMLLLVGVSLAFSAVSAWMFLRQWLRRTEAERAASRSEQRFRSFVEHANDLIFTLSPQGNFVYLSPNWEEVLGHRVSRTLGKPLQSFLHRDDEPGFSLVLQRVLESGKKCSGIEFRVRHLSGAWIWLSVNASLVKGDDAAEETTFLGIGRDISVQKQALAALQESEGRFKRLLQDIPNVAVQGYAPDGTTQYWNRASEELYGYSAQEAIGRNLLELIIPPQLCKEVGEAIAYMARTGEAIPASELALMRKDGSLAQVFSSHVIVQIPGREQELFCIDIDLTEQKRTEQELFQSRYLLDAVIEGTTDAVYVQDACGRYLLFNSAASRITGKPASEVLGQDNSVLFPSHLAEKMTSVGQDVISSGNTLSVEETLPVADGSNRTFLTTKGPLYRPDGGIIGTFGISRDITDQKRWADQILLLNQSLDERVRERTSQLETALREQEAFSYSVSHDLRSPLRAINGYLAILMEDFGDSVPPEARPLLTRSREASARMGRLIDDLLDLARVGRIELVKETVNLSEMARLTVAALQENDPARDVEVEISEGLSARCDRLLLKLVLENLLGNSWKYSSRSATFRLEFGRTSAGGAESFFIKDNGIGFEMAYHDKVFGVFQRLHRTEYEGTGIGLATVKRIMERHGGSVWAESELGKGTTFFFTLP